MSTKKSTAPAAPPAPATGQRVDIKPIVAEAMNGVPANLREPLDKVVLSGMRIMFDQASHKMLLDELDKPGPLATRISNGIIALVYMLWEKSNKTIPPQIIVPATLILTLRAFEFLQESQDPEATAQVLGEAVDQAVTGVMERFNAGPDKIKQAFGGAAPQPGAQPQGGMLSAAKGQ
jgi:hypothetical protein